MFYPELWAEQLYDGNGIHHAGIFPPLLNEKEFSEAYKQEKALRPAISKLALNEDADELALVWMVPLGLTPAGPILREMIAALVHAVDSGKVILVHADKQDTVSAVAALVNAFVGGGHA